MTRALVPIRLDINSPSDASPVAARHSTSASGVFLNFHGIDGDGRVLDDFDLSHAVPVTMAFPYIETPRTDIDGNATYMTNGFRSVGRTHLSALDSVENSFHTPSKDNDVINGFGDGRKRDSGSNKLSTPRAGTTSKPARTALRHLPAAAPAKGEFTPLMRSAAKNNFLKNASAGGDVPNTPAYRRESTRGAAHTPGLPPIDMSDIYEEDATVDQATPVPQAASSSVQSTPHVGLLGRDGAGILGDGQNMTLKEQERV